MAKIKRTAGAVWQGDLRQGEGLLGTETGVLQDTPYSFGSRFKKEKEPGTNPEELIAAAHAACYSMALAHALTEEGYEPEHVEARATCTVSSLPEGGFEISHMRLDVNARVSDLDDETFEDISRQADEGCPVSNLLRPGLEIERHSNLV
jgi:osmotically inducible protein OsmC